MGRRNTSLRCKCGSLKGKFVRERSLKEHTALFRSKGTRLEVSPCRKYLRVQLNR
jgi:hypothetical protein